MNFVGGEDRAREVADEINKNGFKSLALQADVSKEVQVQAMFKKMIDELGTSIFVDGGMTLYPGFATGG